ncbi:MAG TPA: hypothetical protein VHJ82_01170 [Actinomycetota bacterium]|nr:hypothetical protein [Actinomycetota bacterium]
MTVSAMRRSTTVALIVLVATTGCNGQGDLPQPSPSGSARVDITAVRQHARQFDVELRPRGAGSQQEFAAATYIVAHLQQAGYVARLEPVPVKNLVESSNVVALPPAAEPAAIVTIPYDEAANGATIGLWLELARALRVSQPDHAVQFVGLGAEAGRDGRLGTRRQIRMLQETQSDVPIVSFDVGTAAQVSASGPAAREMVSLGRRLGIEAVVVELDSDDLWTAGGFAHTHASGPLQPLARLLIEYLSGS